MNAEVGPKVRVPELKSFNENHDAKELENFLWDMEQFFQATYVLEGEKVFIASMYLIGNEKKCGGAHGREMLRNREGLRSILGKL